MAAPEKQLQSDVLQTLQIVGRCVTHMVTTAAARSLVAAAAASTAVTVATAPLATSSRGRIRVPCPATRRHAGNRVVFSLFCSARRGKGSGTGRRAGSKHRQRPVHVFTEAQQRARKEVYSSQPALSGL